MQQFPKNWLFKLVYQVSYLTRIESTVCGRLSSIIDCHTSKISCVITRPDKQHRSINFRAKERRVKNKNIHYILPAGLIFSPLYPLKTAAATNYSNIIIIWECRRLTLLATPTRPSINSVPK